MAAQKDGQRYETCDGASRGPVFLVAASGGRRQRDQVLGCAHAAGERAIMQPSQPHKAMSAAEHIAQVRRMRREAAHRRAVIAGVLAAATVVVIVLAVVLRFQPAVRADSGGLLLAVLGLVSTPPATRARGSARWRNAVPGDRRPSPSSRLFRPVSRTRPRPRPRRWNSGRFAGRCGSRRRRRPASKRAVRPAMPTWWMSIRWWSRSAPTTTASSRSGMTFERRYPACRGALHRERAGGAGRCHH